MSAPAEPAANQPANESQHDHDDGSEGSGDSQDGEDAVPADHASSAGPYAQAALQSLLAYNAAIAQQVSQTVATDQGTGPGASHGLQPTLSTPSLTPLVLCVMPRILRTLAMLCFFCQPWFAMYTRSSDRQPRDVCAQHDIITGALSAV